MVSELNTLPFGDSLWVKIDDYDLMKARAGAAEAALAAARAEIAVMRAESQDWDSERMAYRRIARAYVALLECECPGGHGDENYHQARALLTLEPQGASGGEG